MTVDRDRGNGYEPRFDIDYQVGRQGELWVEDVRDALVREQVEVKTDERARETGNLYVEFECWRRGKWQPSGIAITTAEVWVFVIQREGLAFVATTALLRRVARECAIRECKTGSHPTKGYVVPIGRLIAQTRRVA